MEIIIGTARHSNTVTHYVCDSVPETVGFPGRTNVFVIENMIVVSAYEYPEGKKTVLPRDQWANAEALDFAREHFSLRAKYDIEKIRRRVRDAVNKTTDAEALIICADILKVKGV